MSEPTRQSIAKFLADVAQDGGPPGSSGRHQAINLALTQQRWELLFEAALAVLGVRRPADTTAQDAAADAIVAYAEALGGTNINTQAAPGYFRTIVKRTFARNLAQRSERPIPMEPERLGTEIENDSQSVEASYASEIWDLITEAAHVAGDAPAEAILTTAWDLDAEGARVTKSAISRRSGYDRTTVHRVMSYVRTFVGENRTQWERLSG